LAAATWPPTSQCVIELKTQNKIHLPSSAPEQAIFTTLLDRLPRLVT
jgi:hypothetical protein